MASANRTSPARDGIDARAWTGHERTGHGTSSTDTDVETDDGYAGPRTVTDDDGLVPSGQMSLVGLVVAAGNALLLLPLAPFFLLARLLAQRRVEDDRS